MLPLLINGFCVASAEPSTKRAIEILSKLTHKHVTWNQRSAVTADVSCDGSPEKIVLGHRGNDVVIGVVPTNRSGNAKVQLFNFPATNTIGQDAFCGGEVHLGSGPLMCRSEDGPLDGCRPKRHCKSFDAYDGECDAFHFYWDSKRKRLTYWRL